MLNYFIDDEELYMCIGGSEWVPSELGRWKCPKLAKIFEKCTLLRGDSAIIFEICLLKIFGKYNMWNLSSSFSIKLFLWKWQSPISLMALISLKHLLSSFILACPWKLESGHLNTYRTTKMFHFQRISFTRNLLRLLLQRDGTVTDDGSSFVLRRRQISDRHSSAGDLRPPFLPRCRSSGRTFLFSLALSATIYYSTSLSSVLANLWTKTKKNFYVLLPHLQWRVRLQQVCFSFLSPLVTSDKIGNNNNSSSAKKRWLCRFGNPYRLKIRWTPYFSSDDTIARPLWCVWRPTLAIQLMHSPSLRFGKGDEIFVLIPMIATMTNVSDLRLVVIPLVGIKSWCSDISFWDRIAFLDTIRWGTQWKIHDHHSHAHLITTCRHNFT